MSRSDPSQSKTLTQIRILLAARLAVVSFFMGIVVFYKVRFASPGAAIPAMGPVWAAYLLTITYAISLKAAVNLKRFAYAQLALDTALASWIIYSTGGLSSPFSFMYILIIIAAALFRNQAATYAIATAAAVFYSSLIWLEHFGFITPYFAFPPLSDAGNFYYVFMIDVLHITTFYFIAVMSGYFTGLISKTGEELKKTSRDFTMLKAFHENVLSNMGLGFLAIDLDRTILSHNPAAERILRISGNEINRRLVDTVLELPDLIGFCDNLDKMTGPARQFDWSYRTPNGEERFLSMTLSRFVASGATHGVIAVFQDMTNLKSMERQVAESERLAAIGRVTAGIAHEIRNPLASLSGSIQVLNADFGPSLDSQNARLMDIIIRETDRLNRIITQFLSYTTPPVTNPEPTDVGKLLSETITLLETNPQYSGKISFVSDLGADIVARVDPEQIKQVLWNLCVNSIDAMDSGGALTVEARWDTMPADAPQAGAACVRICVRDTGAGIDKDHLEHIFDPFYTTKSHGTGLGLATVRKIVDIHRGVIKAESSPGAGSSFIFWLPADESSPVVAPEPSARAVGG